MTGSLAVALAVVMATTALYCAGRLVVAPLRGRASQPGVDLLHLLMGVVMAATLLGLLSRRWDVVWVLTFAATAFWYLREGLVKGNRHSLQHGVGSIAMLAMVASGSSSYAGGVARSLPTAAGMGGMPGMGGATHIGAFAPAGLLLAALAVGVLALTAADTVQLSRGTLARAGGGSASGESPQSRLLAPRCAAGCRITMGVAMAVALFAML